MDVPSEWECINKQAYLCISSVCLPPRMPFHRMNGIANTQNETWFILEVSVVTVVDLISFLVGFSSCIKKKIHKLQANVFETF